MDNIINLITTIIATIEPKDIVDVIIVAYLIYKLISLVRESSGGQVLRGVILVLIAYLLSGWLGLNTLNYLLSSAIQIGIIALFIVFQPELRRMLQQFGQSKFSGLIHIESEGAGIDQDKVITQVVEACNALSLTRTGALIVFERETRLGDIMKNGTTLSAEVSADLIKNIFYPKAPLHDGAVIISKGKIAAAACMLPLSVNTNISRELGTRHRAGIGVSENSDAVAVIVSEETGFIAVAVGGMLKRRLSTDILTQLLRTELIKEKEQKQKKRQSIAFWRPKNKND